jgi:hypothetical protein
MATDLIVDLNSRFVPASIGTKAIDLRWLMYVGFKVPILRDINIDSVLQSVCSMWDITKSEQVQGD